MEADFLHFIQSFDLLIFQETLSLSECTLIGYNEYIEPALKRKGKGRPKGGLSIFVSSSVVCDQERIDLALSWVQCIKLTFNKGTSHAKQEPSFTTSTILKINIYIHPGRKNKAAKIAALAEILKTLQAVYTEALLLATGDFNMNLTSHELLGTIECGNNLQPAKKGKLQMKNIDRDGIRCKGELVKLGLVILNERFNESQRIVYTRSINRKNCTLVFTLTDIQSLSAISKLEIMVRSESNHLPQSITLKLNLQRLPEVNAITSSPHLLNLKKLRWSDSTADNIVSFAKEAIANAPKAVEAGNIIQIWEHLLKSLLSTFQVVASKICHGSIEGKNWLTPEAKRLKKQLNRQGLILFKRGILSKEADRECYEQLRKAYGREVKASRFVIY